MAEFNEIRDQLQKARSGVFDVSRQLFSLRQQLQRCKRQRKQFERFVRPAGATTGDTDNTLAELDAKVSALEKSIETLELDHIALVAEEKIHFADFEIFTDPKEKIGEFSDQIPILLFPLRIETRFKPSSELDSRLSELWVRVYPDDIAIDVFEDTLSESELIKAQSYWVNIWRAGGIEADERAAWRTLVSSHGAGRAFWITENYQPLNLSDKPAKDPEILSIILVVASESVFSEVEKTALGNFWETVWRDDSSAAIDSAFQDLVTAVGENRAIELRETTLPVNFSDFPPDEIDRADIMVSLMFIVFPAADDLPIRENTWAQAPHTNILPDRLVFHGYQDGELTEVLGKQIPSPLIIGPDPSASEEDQLQLEDDNLKLGKEMEWVADFDKAVSIGMGFRIPLDPIAFRTGFDKVVILGIRSSASSENGQELVEQLIAHHHHSRAGFSILPQGRPTNNVEGDTADYNWMEDSDVSFDHYFLNQDIEDPDGWFEKKDGRWLADCLGLDPAKLRQLPHYKRTDIGDARAMNTALWPTTIGYFMETMLHPVFAETTVKQAREFFIKHVSARGMMPAVRIGKQPYGILPATPRSRMNWLVDRSTGDSDARPPASAEMRFLRQLYQLLKKVESDWSPLADQVSFIGKNGDAHQIMLDVLGLHPGSVEHYQRYAESFQQLYNRMVLQGAGGAFIALLIALGYVKSGLDLLEELGHKQSDGMETPDILQKLFLKKPNLLKGDLIDDRPLSESDIIRAYADSGGNYIDWLLESAKTSHNTLRQQKGFIDNRPPTTLLYLMLHHALDLSYIEVSLNLFADVGVLNQQQVVEARREKKFLHVEQAQLAVEEVNGSSRWQYLYQPSELITGDQVQTVGDFIPKVLTSMVATEYLNRQLTALEHLKGASTASLERVFTEHLDLCTYRLDSWISGLMSVQLSKMRFDPRPGPEVDLDGDGSVDAEADQPIDLGGEGKSTNRGLYIGAYGWLENVRPEHKSLTPVELPDDLADVFLRDGEQPLSRDNKNAGYIHAPSLNHAVTAAILRNGYLSNAAPDNPGSLAINLSSERVRLALSIIEGMQGGQSMAALLGYQFERGLHDRHDVEVDEFIYDLRLAFPLNANRFSTTKTLKTDEFGRRIGIRKLEARNVIDGLSMIEHIRNKGISTYPFGLEDMPAASNAQAEAINEQTDRIANIADAVADLAMAESVHQVAQGNYDRAGATLDTYSKGKFPAMPDVIKTPRSGVTLTHRIGLHLETGLDPAAAVNTTPRSKADPAINKWLAQVLPAAARIACVIRIVNPDDETSVRHVVTQNDLGLTSIDLLYKGNIENKKAMTILDDLIEAHVISTHTPRPNQLIEIFYREKAQDIADHVSFFDLSAMLRSLRALVLNSRPLRASDMALTDEASEEGDIDISIDANRAVLIRDELANHNNLLINFRDTLQARIEAEQEEQVINEIDQSITDFAAVVIQISAFLESETGTGAIFDTRQTVFVALLDRLGLLIDRWDNKLVEFDDAITTYTTLPGDVSADRKFIELQKAERRIATVPTDPLPIQPDDFRDDLVNIRRPAFVSRLDAMKVLHVSANALGDLYNAINATVVANQPFDSTGVDLEEEKQKILSLAADLSARSSLISNQAEKTLLSASNSIDTAAEAGNPQEKVDALTVAIKTLLGDDFQVVPDFGLTDVQGDEWGNAWGPDATANRDILKYLENTLKRRFPVDDWLYGISRVREKMHHLENTSLLAEAFETIEILLQPLQFPFRLQDSWLGLDFPTDEESAIDEDKLLYTGHFAVPFNKGLRQGGLLIDEWTEVIPSRNEDTGLAFHYDRPNCEPPQTLLLAMPSEFIGGWQWQDLLDTVHETMDLAKKRAIEPDHIDNTAYARFLPAVVSSVTVHPITASLNYAFNNNLASMLVSAQGAVDE